MLFNPCRSTCVRRRTRFLQVRRNASYRQVCLLTQFVVCAYRSPPLTFFLVTYAFAHTLALGRVVLFDIGIAIVVVFARLLVFALASVPATSTPLHWPSPSSTGSPTLLSMPGLLTSPMLSTSAFSHYLFSVFSLNTTIFPFLTSSLVLPFAVQICV